MRLTQPYVLPRPPGWVTGGVLAALVTLSACLFGDATSTDNATAEAGAGTPFDGLAAAPEVTSDLGRLGQALAFDRILSGNRDVSCMTCHHPELGTDDNRALPSGVDGVGLGADRSGGALIPRNSPHLFNLAAAPNMFWDGRVEVSDDGDLLTPAGDQLSDAMVAVFDHGVVSAQAMFPVTSREEMRGQAGENELADVADEDFVGIWDALMARLGAIPEYVSMFETAYPGTAFEDMTFAHAANAIAQFEVEAFTMTDTPWHRFQRGDRGALSAAQRRGLDAFRRANCDRCHMGPELSDFEHHNTAVPQLGPGKGDGANGNDDFGRFGVTGNRRDLYRFRTPSLTNVALTGPWGHDGTYNDLREFVEHYRDPEDELRDYDPTEHVDDASLHAMYLTDNHDAILANLSRRLDNRRGFDADAIVDFLHSMTDPAVLQLDAIVPDSVPSGLAVETVGVLDLGGEVVITEGDDDGGGRPGGGRPGGSGGRPGGGGGGGGGGGPRR